MFQKLVWIHKTIYCKVHFSDNAEIRYQVVSGFVFLRFFAPAILGPRFFDLVEDTPVSVNIDVIFSIVLLYCKIIPYMKKLDCLEW